MKRNRETYKLGRKIMNSLRVPMTSNSNGITVNLHYRKNMSSNYPVKRADGTYTNGVSHIRAGQLRMRRAKNTSEVAKFYGSAIDSAIDSAKSSIENSGFDRTISYSYSSASATSASSASASNDSNSANSANSSDINKPSWV